MDFLDQAIAAAAAKAFVVLDGTLLRIDRVGMASGQDRPYYSGKHKQHGVNVQVIAVPAGRLVWAAGSRHEIAAAPRTRHPRRPARGRDSHGGPTPATRAPAQQSAFPNGGVTSTPTPAATGTLGRGSPT